MTSAGVEWVIRGGTVVTVNDACEVLERDVHIARGRIAALMPWGSSIPEGAREVSATGCAVLPGFVQTHVHLCQTLFRNLADDLSLLDWLAARIWPLEGAHDPDSLYASARLGAAELLRGGTTAILDMGTVRHHDAVMQAIADMGLRAVSGKAMMDAPGTPDCLAETTAESLDASHALCERWNGRDGGRIRYAYAPRFAVSCTDDLLREAARAARERDALFHTHASENRDEIALVEARTGQRNIAYLEDVGALGSHCCIAHCVWVDDDEVARLARTGTHVLHCPSSNLKLGSGLCDVPRLQRAGVHVTIGADGAPCNNNMSAFMEMRLAALLQKPGHGPTAMPAAHVLAMATREGARALGWGDELGSIEVGKRADAIVVDLSGLHLGPGRTSIEGQLVYGARDEDVIAVFVDGHLMVQGGALVGSSTADIGEDARKALPRVMRRAGLS